MNEIIIPTNLTINKQLKNIINKYYNNSNNSNNSNNYNNNNYNNFKRYLKEIQIEENKHNNNNNNISQNDYNERYNEGNLYYNWLVIKQKLSYYNNNNMNEGEEDNEEIKKIINKYHNKLINITNGSLLLTLDDQNIFKNMLSNNNGTKDMIKLIRTWIIHYSHSFYEIIYLIYDYICYEIKENKFMKILHVLYVINDVLMNKSTATTKGPYTDIMGDDWNYEVVDICSIMLPYLLRIIYEAYINASNDIDREKLKKLVGLWSTKQFFSQNDIQSIEKIFTGDYVRTEIPQYDSLHSPGIEIPRSLLQSTKSTTSTSILNSTPPPVTTIETTSTNNNISNINNNNDNNQLQSLEYISVGKMSEVISLYLSKGIEKYSPIPLLSSSTISTEQYQPKSSNLDDTVKLYYQRLQSYNENESSNIPNNNNNNNKSNNYNYNQRKRVREYSPPRKSFESKKEEPRSNNFNNYNNYNNNPSNYNQTNTTNTHNTNSNLDNDFSSYRNQMSTGYFKKIAIRSNNQYKRG